MTSKEIRQSFLDFFKKYDHQIVPSAPVVPMDDPTLLFTNAGMNQFKDVFLETGSRPYSRAADSQKCIRVSGKHNDLEEVGHDTYHHTFFEMLGNWSFGDYYKEEVIAWAWELITKVWGLPKHNLYATVFREDDEAEMLWKKVTDIDPSHVMRFNEKDNFWEMGVTGPCGPCSEIHIDLGEGFCDKQHIPGHQCGVNAGCARFIELWNLVFIQFNRDETGALSPLPKKHVDTGMGFERISAVIQRVDSNYKTDVFTPIMNSITDLTGKSPLEDRSLQPTFSVIADHIRALSFAITDGALPSNEGRGYVLRRLLRRAARYGRNLDMREPFIYKLVSTLANTMGEAYPELSERAQHTTSVIKVEEERFNEVLDRGIEIFNQLAETADKKGHKILAGPDVFKLYDTFGFPLDLTQLMAREKGLSVDEAGFQEEMNKQRQRARDSHHFVHMGIAEWNVLTEGSDSKFIGYKTTASQSVIRKFRMEGDQITLLLDQTPFYGESGGQVGDKGTIQGKGFRINITDTQKEGDQILHLGEFIEGNSITQPEVTASLAADNRLSTARNHTATHLLHKALKEVLGDHVNQAGSLVEPERLRFDFTHFEAMTPDQINEVEWRVNASVRKNMSVETSQHSIAEAKAKGATALFGEKYGEIVRVVQIEDYSMELCGGTHIHATGEIGYFRILGEEGIAAGVRRIEAATGEKADHLLREEKKLIAETAQLLKCRPDEIESRIRALIEDRKNWEKKYKKAMQSQAGSQLDTWIQNAVEAAGIRIVSEKIDVESVDELRTIGDQLRGQMKSGVGVLGAVIGDKVNILCVVTDDLIKSKNLKAGDIVKTVSQLVGGSGGGKPHLALAGGKETDKVDEALKQVPEIVQQFLLVGKFLGAMRDRLHQKQLPILSHIFQKHI